MRKVQRKSVEDAMLSILNHSERREILRILAASPEGIKYSNILEEAGLTTSKLNYQLKELDGFFEKNQDGLYMLSVLGRKAVNLLVYLNENIDEADSELPVFSESHQSPNVFDIRIIVIVFVVGLFLGVVTVSIISPEVDTSVYEDRIAELEQQASEKENELIQLNQELESIQAEVTEKNSQISLYETTIESYTTRIEELEQRLDKSETRLKHGITYLSTNWHYEPYYLSDVEIERDFQLFKDYGIENITLVAIWKHIEPSPGKYNDAALDDIIRVCRYAERYGLGVIIDFHSMMMEDSFTMPEWLRPRKFKTVIDNETTRQAWLDYLDHCVEYMKDDPAIASWHMMNEPSRLDWGCNCTVDEFIDLWTEMRTIFKTHSTKPVSIRFGGDTFDTHFNRDPRIYEICDYISFNIYQTTNRELVREMVTQVYANNSYVMISEYGLSTDDDCTQFDAFERDIRYFDDMEVDYCVAWYWRADYDQGIPEGPGSGYNLASTIEGEARPAFRLIQLIP